MKVIVPMSGLGSRFIAAGYKDPKPLIKVDGKPIIAYVCDMFKSKQEDVEFVFICRKEHVENTKIVDILKEISPNSQIFTIKNHKRGPVYAVSQIFDAIKDDDEIAVSYCDYYMKWDFDDFLQSVRKSGASGSVPCYSGFHPNLLPEKNLYAGCLIDKDYNLLEIREKFSFEADKAKGYHSPGVYYFKNGAILKKYFQEALDKDLSLNDEFYVSLVYQLMLRDKLKIYVYDKIDYFCQWGTPQDLQEYQFWLNCVKKW